MTTTQTYRLDKDCPDCRGYGYSNTQSADRGGHTYKFDCPACWGSGRVPASATSPLPGQSDHTHECRDCGGDFTGCSLDNETCLTKGSPDFGGLCDDCMKANPGASFGQCTGRERPMPISR